MYDGDGDDDGVGWLKGKNGQKENSQCVGWNYDVLVLDGVDDDGDDDDHDKAVMLW